MFKFITMAFTNQFVFNLTANFYSPSSYYVSWETMYPSMWQVITDTCKIEQMHITGRMPYRITAYLTNCTHLPQQHFVVRNGDLDIYNCCALDMYHDGTKNLHCDFYHVKK